VPRSPVGPQVPSAKAPQSKSKLPSFTHGPVSGETVRI
jgi:hypothetical protein